MAKAEPTPALASSLPLIALVAASSAGGKPQLVSKVMQAAMMARSAMANPPPNPAAMPTTGSDYPDNHCNHDDRFSLPLVVRLLDLDFWRRDGCGFERF